MKTLISENDGYKVYVELLDFLRSEGDLHMKLITVDENADNPLEEEVKFRTILSAEGRRRLKELL